MGSTPTTQASDVRESERDDAICHGCENRFCVGCNPWMTHQATEFLKCVLFCGNDDKRGYRETKSVEMSPRSSKDA